MTRHLEVGWWGPSHGPWCWIQNQFEHMTILDRATIEDWMTSKDSRSGDAAKVTLIAIEHRSEIEPTAWIHDHMGPHATASVVREPGTGAARKSKSSVPMAVVLGNDWHGHRRTQPLPESMPSFYWYQWYDRLFAWLSEVGCEGAGRGGGRKPSGQRHGDAPAWRVQWTMDRSSWQSSMLGAEDRSNTLAWIITDHVDQRDMWQDACGSIGIQTVASRWDRDPPWLDPQLIVVDCVSRSDRSECAIHNAMASARKRFPNAFLAIATSFPTWESWSDLHNRGVDAILPRPAEVRGFLLYWQQWMNRVAT